MGALGRIASPIITVRFAVFESSYTISKIAGFDILGLPCCIYFEWLN